MPPNYNCVCVWVRVPGVSLFQLRRSPLLLFHFSRFPFDFPSIYMYVRLCLSGIQAKTHTQDTRTQTSVRQKLLRYVQHHKKDKTITIKIIYTHSRGHTTPCSLPAHPPPYVYHICVWVLYENKRKPLRYERPQGIQANTPRSRQPAFLGIRASMVNAFAVAYSFVFTQ